MILRSETQKKNLTEGLYTKKILTKKELDDPDHKVLDELFGKINKSPVDGNNFNSFKTSTLRSFVSCSDKKASCRIRAIFARSG